MFWKLFTASAGPQRLSMVSAPVCQKMSNPGAQCSEGSGRAAAECAAMPWILETGRAGKLFGKKDLLAHDSAWRKLVSEVSLRDRGLGTNCHADL